MLREEDGKLDNAAVQSICYKYYSGEKKGEITFPKWFSSTCTYRLWMVFCVLVEDNSLDVSKDVFTDVLKRLLELSGFNWTDEPENLKSNDIFDFPLFLETITQCFEKFKLESSLTCEVIEDLHDEYVCGVQKKGYLVKKGHVRKNFKKRWFVLQRTTMSYYDSRENMEKKVAKHLVCVCLGAGVVSFSCLKQHTHAHSHAHSCTHTHMHCFGNWGGAVFVCHTYMLVLLHLALICATGNSL